LHKNPNLKLRNSVKIQQFWSQTFFAFLLIFQDFFDIIIKLLRGFSPDERFYSLFFYWRIYQ